MVRKLGKNLIKQAKKEFKNVKPLKNEEMQDKLALGYISLCGSRIVKECLELFSLSRQFEQWKAKGKLRGALDLKFNHYIFCQASFKVELSVIKQLFDFFRRLEDKPQEIRLKALSIGKNTKMKMAHDINVMFYVEAFHKTIGEHLKDIEDNHDLRCIVNMLYILGAVFSIKDQLSTVKREELHEFYTDKEITRLKQITTRLTNLTWGILESLTAFNVSKETLKKEIENKLNNIVVRVDKNYKYNSFEFDV